MSNTLPVRTALLLGILFFLICAGLGYPILNRYDPGKVPGTSDAADYCNRVRQPLQLASYRPFVPMLAKPFYRLALGRSGSWDPALFGMLMATSLLTAATAVTIVAIGLQCGLPYTTSLLGALLYLASFAVANWNLAAYVDSGEALFLALVAWSLLSRRWALLALWALPGSFSKETFAPFAVCFALAWWLADRPLRPRRLGWVAALALLSGAAVLLSFFDGSLLSGAMHYTTGMSDFGKVGFGRALLRTLTAREFLYAFLWLLPLGVVQLRFLDRRWVFATAATFLLALLFGGYNDALGNTTRAFFNISGPLLSLSAALLLSGTLPENEGCPLCLASSVQSAAPERCFLHAD